MSDMGGLDIGAPQEGMTGAPEELSEDAKQRFAAAAAAMQQIRREEKKARKRDTKVAQVIAQFLQDERHAHLFQLIARLAARDCPSIFILAVLSLIHGESRDEVQEHLSEVLKTTPQESVDGLALTKVGELDADTTRGLVEWITRMQMVLSVEPEKILLRLMIDERNIDGTVLQLSTFVLQEFFQEHNRSVSFEKLQPLTASILQTVFEPFLRSARKALLDRREREEEARRKKED